MTTPHEIRTFVDSTRPRNWYGQCAGLTYRTIKECGGSSLDAPYPSARAAYLAAEIESRDPRAAPPGAIHYWDYTGTDDEGRVARWGHVAIDIYGGGHHVLSATGYAHEWWGVKAGLITVEAQTARGMPYLGWSRTYGRRNRLSISTPQSAGGKPAASDTHHPEEDDMYDDEAKRVDRERHEELLRKLDDVARVAAPFKVFQWGTGHVVVNPENGRLWILPQGYGELLTHLGYRAGDVKSIGDGELGFITRFLPDAIGTAAPQGGEGFTDEDLDAIRTAINESAITLSQMQYEQLVAAVTQGARSGGEEGARKALDDLTLVVKTA